MADNGPSWWQMRVVPDLHLPQRSSVTDSTFFMIFESFDRNATKHAILRVAITNGNLSSEGTYSHDEIFCASKFSRSSTEYAAKMRAAIDDTENNAVTVEIDPGTSHNCILRIDLGSAGSHVTLELKENIDEATFVNRLMTYLTHVEAKRRMEKERLESRQRKRDTLQSFVEQAVSKKLDENRKLETGLRVLMTEKRNHWKK